MERFSAQTLLAKRLVAGVVITNVVVAGIIGVSLHRSKENHREYAAVSTQNIARILDEELSGTIKNVDLAIRSVTDEAERQLHAGGIGEPAFNAFIERVHGRLPELVAFRATNEQGDAIYGPKVRPVKTSSLAHRDYFAYLRDHPQAGLVISNPLIGGISGKLMIILARRINRPDGGFAGLVYAGLSIESLTKSFAKINVGTRGSISLRDAELNIIARNRPYKYEVMSDAEKPTTPQLRGVLDSGTAQGTFIATSRVDGVERTFSLRRLALAKPFYLTVGLATDEYLAAWRREVFLMTAFLLLFATMTSGAAWLLNREWHRFNVAARDRANRLKTIIDAAMDGFVVVDPAGGITEVNDTYCRISGYSRQELLHMSLHDLEAAESAAEIASHINEMTAQGGDRFESKHRGKDGRLIDVEISAQYLAVEGGRFVSFVRDITDRKRSERLLRESEVRYRTIVENQVEFVCRFLPGGVITFVNASLAAWACAADAPVLGRSFYDFIHADDRAGVISTLDALSPEQPIAAVESRIVSADGTVHWQLWVTVALFDAEGQIIEFQGVGRDITDSKQAELFLVRAKDILESEVRERTASLREANSKLQQEIEERERIERYLIGYQRRLETMSFELANATENERARIAGELHDQVGQRLILARLKTDMLAGSLAAPEHLRAIEELQELNDQTLTDIRSLTFQMRPPVLASAGLVAAVRWLGEELKNQYGLSVEVAGGITVDNLSYLLKSVLFQVIRELLLNVIKHAGTDRATVSLALDAGFVTITVDDAGRGFDPAHATEKHHLSGGFGIYNSSHRIEYLGGSLTIDAAPGHGCRATIVVPLAADTAGGARVPAAAAGGGGAPAAGAP